MKDCELEKLWMQLGDIPVDKDDNIEQSFYIWKKGTSKIDIWTWFDENHSRGLYVMKQNIKSRGDAGGNDRQGKVSEGVQGKQQCMPQCGVETREPHS